MYKKLAAVFICLLAHLSGTEYICSQPILSLHKEPRELSEVVSQVIWGDSVEFVPVKAVTNGWIKVKAGDSAIGWVPVSSLSLPTTIYPNPNNASLVTSRMAHVYLVRDVKTYPPLLTLPYGAKLELASTQDVVTDKWVQVRLIDGEVAYIHRSDISTTQKYLSKLEMVALAKSFIGVPYTWGGVTPQGFDAPGLMHMLYRQMGVTLAREPSDQAAMSELTQVSPKQLDIGDLVFFSLKDNGQIDHVGMYLGNNEFIHASVKNSPPSVQVTSLTTPYWQASLKKCCHVE
ncbi:MAG: C40 family peptidase [Chlamydiales bacterium]|nr:C40 family peptidase [Chlamydiales bacterium]